MNLDDLFIIGDIAKICDISTQTLRHYDKINFLKPDYVEPDNGYRYYSSEKLLMLLSIKHLKGIGFSLNQIKEYLENSDNYIINDLYQRKRDELSEKVREYTNSIERLDARLELFNLYFGKNKKLENSDNTISIREINARHVAYTRRLIEFNFKNRILLSLESQNNRRKHNYTCVSPITHVIHSDYREILSGLADVEICLELKNDAEVIEGETRVIEGGLFLTAMHHGDHSTSFPLYESMLTAIKEKGYWIAGPVLLCYVATLTEVKSPDRVVFEIQIPIKK